MAARLAGWWVKQMQRRGFAVGRLGRKVISLLDQVVSLHAVSQELEADPRQWATEHYVELRVCAGTLSRLSTWDHQVLTALVVGAHDACLRLEIGPVLVRWEGLLDDEGTYRELKRVIDEATDPDAISTSGAAAHCPAVLALLQKSSEEACWRVRKYVWEKQRNATPDPFLDALRNVVDPGDEHQHARRLYAVLRDEGYDPGDFLGQPGLKLSFSPRVRDGRVVTGHPTMEDAVARVRTYVEPLHGEDADTGGGRPAVHPAPPQEGSGPPGTSSQGGQ